MAQTKKVTDITRTPAGTQTLTVGGIATTEFYKCIKYLSFTVESHTIHIMGTRRCSDWAMVMAYDLYLNMISEILLLTDRDAFDGYQVIITGKGDPPFNTSMQRATASSLGTIWTDEFVCRSNQAFLDPTNASKNKWRGWNTPVHEFGHSIQNNVSGLKTALDAAYTANASLDAETVATGFQAWYDVGTSVSGASTRAGMPAWEKDAFAAYFDVNDAWRPTCDALDAQTPVKILEIRDQKVRVRYSDDQNKDHWIDISGAANNAAVSTILAQYYVDNIQAKRTAFNNALSEFDNDLTVRISPDEDVYEDIQAAVDAL